METLCQDVGPSPPPSLDGAFHGLPRLQTEQLSPPSSPEAFTCVTPPMPGCAQGVWGMWGQRRLAPGSFRRPPGPSGGSKLCLCCRVSGTQAVPSPVTRLSRESPVGGGYVHSTWVSPLPREPPPPFQQLVGKRCSAPSVCSLTFRKRSEHPLDGSQHHGAGRGATKVARFSLGLLGDGIPSQHHESVSRMEFSV